MYPHDIIYAVVEFKLVRSVLEEQYHIFNLHFNSKCCGLDSVYNCVGAPFF